MVDPLVPVQPLEHVGLDVARAPQHVPVVTLDLFEPLQGKGREQDDNRKKSVRRRPVRAVSAGQQGEKIGARALPGWPEPGRHPRE